jgi:hypothetical protein
MCPKKVDANHIDIVKGLRAVGAEVQSLAALGRGAPDVLVGFRKTWYVAELKDGKKSASRRKLTEAEKIWHERFSRIAPVHIWTSLEEALKTIGAL